MLGKRLIKTSAGAACTTDTVQILDGVPFQSIATYELDGDATNLVETGYINKAGVFNGSSSRINLPSNPINGLSSVSFSFWIKPNDIASYQYVLSFINSVDGWNGVGIRITNTGKIQVVRANSGAVTTTENSTTTLSLNVWQHVAVSVQQSGTVIYINGSPDGTFSNTPFTTNNTGSFDIGMNEYASGVTQAFTNASIDQVRIFNRVITANEVTTLYGETSASSTKSTTDIFADSSALALYEFEGNANDTGGTYNGTATDVLYNEYDGTASNVTYSTGKFGQAGVFNGSNADIDLPSNIDSTTMSISFWIYIDSIVTGNEVVIELENGYGVWFLASAGGKLGMQSSNANSAHTLSNSQLSAGSWHHVAAVWNSGSRTFYIDNTVQSGGSVTDYLTCNENTIGSRRSGEFFDGKIDQVRIYDKAISAADVTTLYNETVATASTNITLEVPSLVAYYKMSDATDETGSYDGTPTNVNFNVAGKFGNAGEFNGSSSYISRNSAFLPTGNASRTFSFWTKLDTHVTDAYFMSYGDGVAGQFFSPRVTPVSQGGYISFMGYAADLNSNVVMTTGEWMHLCYTYNGTTLKIYKNAVEIASGNLSLNTSQTRNFIIGARDYNGSITKHIDGKIDQVRIFDRAITADEVTKLYNEVYCQPTIVPTDHFEPVIYTGSGSSQSISTLDFQPDFTWIKDRSIVVDHALFDSVRGATKVIRSNRTNVEGTHSDSLTSFNNNGFSLGSDGVWWVNKSADNYVAWNWKAGGAAVSNTDGTITSQVSANTDAGFSIVSYAGNNAASATIGHGLDSAPEMVIIKARNFGAGWPTLGVPGGNFTYCRRLNDIAVDNPSGYYSIFFNSTLPTSSVFSVGNSDEVNDGYNYIAYCFHSVDGMSKIGSYVGNFSFDGPTIVTGFRPAFLMIKRTDIAGNWFIFDNKRSTTNERDDFLHPNLNAAETTNSAAYSVDFLSNGFQIKGNGDQINGNNGTHIYMAFAEENVEPQPVLANSFNTVLYTGNGSATQSINTVGFQPDLVWIKARGLAQAPNIFDSIRGGELLRTSTTSASGGDYIGYINNGFQFKITDAGWNQNGQNYVAWNWKASNDSTINQEGSITSIVSVNPAAGFSVVKYTGTGSNASFGHGLSSLPELVIVKRTNATEDWFVLYDTTNTPPNYMKLNTTSAGGTSSGVFPSPATSTVVNVGNDTSTNSSGSTYIAYCFTSISGYSKVGSYTGTNATNSVTTGFEPSFLMVKLTSAIDGQWVMYDNARSATNPRTKKLAANSSVAENDPSLLGGDSSHQVNFTSTGFELLETSGGVNTNKLNETYIYLAIKAN